MVKFTIHNALDELSSRFIPEGKHPLLYIDSREAWKELMTDLLNRDSIPKRLSFITKCAFNWEALLFQRQSLLN